MVALGLLTPPADLVASDFEAMGYARLEAALGAAMPDGTGIEVVHTEGTESPSKYLPEATPGTVPGSFTGAVAPFVGKSFTAVSPGGTGASSHAAAVGGIFYGSGSMAPGIATITCYDANDYFFGSAYTEAAARSGKVQNHSWAAHFSGYNTELRKFDRDIDLNGYLPVVGLLNHFPPAEAPPIPELIASAYNVLSVGMSDGHHSAGETLGNIDGAGRMKPEVVAPDTVPPVYVSHAVPAVSAIVALLRDVADGDPGLSDALDQTEVMKAIVMAGATKEEFFTGSYKWSRTSLKPLDGHYGAGEVNVYESYRVLTGGKQGAGSAISDYGWDFGTAPDDVIVREYLFSHSEDPYLNEFSVVLNWNRVVDKLGPIYTPRDHDLALELIDEATGTVIWDASDSAEDNVEHIYYRNLPAGNYRLRVSRNDSGTDTVRYGLAWRMEPGGGARITGAVHDGADMILITENLDPSITYAIQRSPSLAPGNWADINPAFMPSTTSESWTDTGVSGPKQYYRLCWTPRVGPPAP